VSATSSGADSVREQLQGALERRLGQRAEAEHDAARAAGLEAMQLEAFEADAAPGGAGDQRVLVRHVGEDELPPRRADPPVRQPARERVEQDGAARVAADAHAPHVAIELAALEEPGTTWRDRPAIDRGDGVLIAGDWAAAPGLLSEVAWASAAEAGRRAIELARAARPPLRRVA
jgi:hypothetical protein